MKSEVEPEAAIRLFGEPREPASGREVSLGPLSFTLEGLALRWISFAGVEVLRGIAFVVRDRDWGTYQPAVTIDEFTKEPGGILIRLAASITEGETTLECRMVVQAATDRLSLLGSVTSRGRFQTNRTGFVVLHPAACAGGPARVEHAAGGITAGQFPKLVSPHQPFFDIAAIEHEPAQDLAAYVQFSGEVFEMEDQRNWSDASFKTYSRPLARPFPYTIGDGETVAQTVRVTMRGRPPAARSGRRDVPRIELITDAGGRLPRLGLGGRARDYRGTAVQRRRLAGLKPAILMLEADADDPGDGFRDAVAASGAEAAVMLRPGADALSAWHERLVRAGVEPAEVALVTTEQAVVDEARQLFPGARIGAGTDAFFAEFNRKPPPAADFAFWTVNPTVHAEDDASVMETLSVLADQAATARTLVPDVPLWCGPVTLRMRFNPNATGPAASDAAEAAPPNADVRQRGLIAAAFALGQIAAWAVAGLETVTFFAPFGPCGVIHAPDKSPVPWFDGCEEGAVYPPYLVLAGLAGQPAQPLRALRNEAEGRVVALATAGSLWLANRGPAAVEIAVPGTRVRMLDETTFAEATSRPEGFWDRGAASLDGRRLRLGAYAVARVRL